MAGDGSPTKKRKRGQENATAGPGPSTMAARSQTRARLRSPTPEFNMDSDSSELPERILPLEKPLKKRSEPTSPKTQRKQRQPERGTQSTPQSYKRPRGSLVKLGHFTINSDGEDVEELEQRKRKRKKPRKAPSKEATDRMNTVPSSQTPCSVRIREEGNTIVILSSDEETEPPGPVSASVVHSDSPVQQAPSPPPALPSPAPPSPAPPPPASTTEQPPPSPVTYEPGELQAIYDDALQRSIERHKNRPRGPRRKHHIFQSRTLQMLPPITYSDAPPSRSYPLLTPKLFEHTLKGLVNQTKVLSSTGTQVFSKPSPSQQEIEQRPSTDNPPSPGPPPLAASPGPPPLTASPSPPPLRPSSLPRASSSTPPPSPFSSSPPPPPPSSFVPQFSSPQPTPPPVTIQKESAMDEDPDQTIQDIDVQMEDVSPPSITPSRSATLSDSSTPQMIAVVEEESGRAYPANIEEDEEEAVNLSLVRGSITPSYAQPMSREDSEEGPARRQQSVPVPHPSDTADPTTAEKVKPISGAEEALEHPSLNNTVEPTPMQIPPRSLSSPISSTGAQTPLPQTNGLSVALPPLPTTTTTTPSSVAAYQPPRVNITQPQPQLADMGLSLEQRRAVSWSACRAALEKYEGQQGCNELVLKMLIDSSAVIDAALVEATAQAYNSTGGVPVNGIASWGSTMLEREGDVSIDDDDDDDDVDDDCFGSLELAYPD